MAHLLTTVSATLGLIKETVEEDEDAEGFDSLMLRRRIRASSTKAARQSVALGSKPTGYLNMYCVKRRAVPVVCGVYDAEFSFRGVLDGGKAYKIRGRSFSERQSAEEANYPGYSAVPVESNQGLVGITINYLATAPPDLDEVGTNQTPPVNLTPPSFWVPPTNIWTFIEEPIHVYPYGWVLDGRELELIPGSNVAAVTDQYVFYHHFKVGR